MARHARHEEHENHERWLVSYADFITLLFAFFVVLYATSTQNEQKEKQFEESVKQSLNIVAQGVGAGQASGSAGTVIEPFEGYSKNSSTDISEALNQYLEEQLGPDKKQRAVASIKHDAMGVKIQLAASEYFPVGSAKLKANSLAALTRIGLLLKHTKNKIVIEGHTDDLPLENSSFESNWELASHRATTIVRYLIKAHGIDAKRLAAVSYADQKPIVANDSPENRAKNRRIEILLLSDGRDSRGDL